MCMDSEDRDPGSDIVIRPLRLARRMGLGAALFLIVAGGVSIWQGTWVSPGWPQTVTGASAAVIGVVAAIRNHRVRIVLRRDEMVVYGQLWSRSVPRASITSITPWPSVKWTDSRGRERSTPVTPLFTGRDAAPELAEHALRGRKTLHEWAGLVT